MCCAAQPIEDAMSDFALTECTTQGELDEDI